MSKQVSDLGIVFSVFFSIRILPTQWLYKNGNKRTELENLFKLLECFNIFYSVKVFCLGNSLIMGSSLAECTLNGYIIFNNSCVKIKYQESGRSGVLVLRKQVD